MPNHVTNRLVIDAMDDKELGEIRDFIAGKDDEGHDVALSFQQIRPMPEGLEGTQAPANDITQEETNRRKMLYGAKDWYEWRLKYWSTKWNCYEVREISESCIEFDTAWSTPVELILYLSQKFPITVFQVEYADEDLGYNCGSYSCKDGKIIEQSNPPEGSEEAMRFACDVKGYDYEEEMAERAECEADSEETYSMPAMCPECGSKLTWTNSSGELQCDNCGFSETE